MRPDDFNEPGGRSRSRGGRFELFFYERVGERYYLRFTRLALILVVCLTVVPCVAILALYYKQSRAAPEDVNINVGVRPRPPANYGTIVVPPPVAMPPPVVMPSPPKVSRSPRGGEPARQTPATPGSNANTTLTPTPTPSPTPPRPPS
jgi:hypothetical protein